MSKIDETKDEDKKLVDLKVLEDKISSLEDQLKRAVADYRNLERRVKEDGLALATYSRGQLIVSILPVLDSLDKAVEGAGKNDSDPSGWLKGVILSIKELRQVLSEEGLLEIDTSNNFDPNLHEAVDTIEGKDGKIIQVVLRGYTLNGKVLRPAKVVVGKSEKSDLTQDQEKTLKEEEKFNG